MSLKRTVWVPMGPSPIAENSTQDNGLVSAIAINPNDPNVLYIGTVGGGAWRSNDAGATWTPIIDRLRSLGVGDPGALAIDPNATGTIYIGTSGRYNQEQQAGLFKSTDGGASWISVGSGFPAGNTGNAVQFTGQWINVVIVDPADGNTVYLASSSGVFRSRDGGQNWRFGTNSSGDARSLVIDASSPAGARILYAGINQRGVFRSSDGGRTWTQILSGATPAVAAAVGPAPNAFGSVIVDVAPPTAPPNPGGVQVLYATLEGTNGAPDPVGVFSSVDQGATWTQRAAAAMPTNTQGGYSFGMAVDPGSPGDGANDIIYFGAVGQKKSTDSGASFAAVGPGLHADTHTWAFIPQPGPNPSIVFNGNDGGIFKSADGGASWTPLNSGGLQTGLLYNIDIRPDAAGSVTVGALQDNAVETTRGAGGLGWIAGGGDGWDVAYDATAPGQVYASSGFWSPAPCTRVYRSTDDGLSFPTEITPWDTTTDLGCYLAPVATDPTTGGIVYVSGSQNLWQSRDGGNSWRKLRAFGTTGYMDVASADGRHVVIAVNNQVFVSTNALAPTVGPPSGVTFTDITRNLPNRNVSRAVFNPNDPNEIYAVVGGFGVPGDRGHVFRTTVGGAAWTDVSPGVDIPFNAIVLDGSDTPSTIYVGTEFGVLRSVDRGSSWSVLDDIHFPRVPVLDLVLAKQPGILRAATYGRGVFQFVTPAGPSISVDLESGLDYGTVCTGPQYQSLEIYNAGTSDLVVNSVQRLMGSTGFAVLPFPSTPLVVAPGEQIEFTISFTPTTAGTAEQAIIRISSNDPTAPFVDLAATGLGGLGALETAIPDGGSFGNVCLGSFADEDLLISNSGACPLTIFDVNSSSPEFIVAHVTAFPLVVAAGGDVEIPIRFQPAAFGVTVGLITVLSDGGFRAVPVSGEAPAPRLASIIADAGNFGHTCVGFFKDEELTLSNSGRCALTVFNITSSSAEFLVPAVLSFPLVVAAGAAIEIPIRFQPLSFGNKSAVITLVSDDPAGVRTIHVSGFAPSGKLAVTGSARFGGVGLGEHAQQIISVCNVGECDLHVTSVRLRHHRHHFRLIHNPFPATLAPGSCLNVVIRFKATCEWRKETHLLIECDDPDMPVKRLEVTAHTRRTLRAALRCWLAYQVHEILEEGDEEDEEEEDHDHHHDHDHDDDEHDDD